MAGRTRIANARKSKVRSAVEHVFAYQKGPMVLVVRTIGIARARVKIGLANLAYNMRRFVWLDGRASCSRLSDAEAANQRTRHLENPIPIDGAIAAALARSPTILHQPRRNRVFGGVHFCSERNSGRQRPPLLSIARKNLPPTGRLTRRSRGYASAGRRPLRKNNKPKTTQTRTIGSDFSSFSGVKNIGRRKSQADCECQRARTCPLLRRSRTGQDSRPAGPASLSGPRRRGARRRRARGSREAASVREGVARSTSHHPSSNSSH